MQWRPALPLPPVNTMRFPVDMIVVIEGDEIRGTRTVDAREEERKLETYRSLSIY